MRKQYMLMLMVLLGLLGFSARAADVGKFIVNVDDASKIIMVKSNWETVNLVDGRNEFEPTELVDASFYGNGCSIYKASIDGTELTAGFGGMYILGNLPGAGKVLDIQVNFPAEDLSIRFNYTDEAGAITRAAVGTNKGGIVSYADVPIVDNAISVKAGSTVYLWSVPQDDWIISSITAPNGDKLKWSKFPVVDGVQEPNTSFVADREGNLTVNSRKVTDIDVVFNIIGDPSKVNFTYGDPFSDKMWSSIPLLQEGRNLVTMKDGYGVRVSGNGLESLTFRRSAGAELETAKQSMYDMTWYAGEFASGGELTATMKGAVAPSTIDVSLTINNPEYIKLYSVYSVEDPSRNKEIVWPLKAGENTVSVPESSNGLATIIIAPSKGTYVVDNVKFRYEDEEEDDWHNVVGNPENANVYTIYAYKGTKIVVEASLAPAMVNLEFVVSSISGETADVRVKDVKLNDTVDVTDITAPIEMEPGTKVTFSVAAPENVDFSVAYGNATLTPDTNGTYAITVTENSKVTVTYTTGGVLGNFIVNVDDASKVIMVKSNWETVNLVDGRNEFGPTELVDASFYGNGCSIYKASIDGTELTAGLGGMYLLGKLPGAGKVLDIQVNFPAEDLNIRLNYTNEAGAITRAATGTEKDGSVTYTDVPIVDNAISVKAGSTVYLWSVPQDDWVVSSITAPNGDKLKWSKFPIVDGVQVPNTSFIADREGDVTLDCRKVTDIDVVFNIIGDPSKVNFTYGDPFSEERIWPSVPSLKEGRNVVKMKDGYGVRVYGNMEGMTFRRSSGAELETSKQSMFDGTWYAGEFAAGGELTATIEKTVAPSTIDISLTINNPEYIKLYSVYSVEDPSHNEEIACTLTAGENTVSVPVSNDGSARIIITPSEETYVVNSVKFRYEDEEDDWHNVYEDPENANVYTIYAYKGTKIEVEAGLAPVMVNLEFEVSSISDETADVRVTDVKLNGTVEVADITAPIEMESGTEVTFAVAAPENVDFSVVYCDSVLTPDANGTYAITVTEDSKVTVAYTTSGISTVINGEDEAIYFDISGRQVNARNIGSGLYIKVSGGSVSKIMVK